MYKCRLVTGVDGEHPRDALAILGVVPSEDNDPICEHMSGLHGASGHQGCARKLWTRCMRQVCHQQSSGEMPRVSREHQLCTACVLKPA